jgi:hypothetical protein
MSNQMKNVRKTMFRSAAVASFFLPFVAFAQNTSITINTNLPGPNASSTGIAGFIANFYIFALMISGILAFGAVVYGGIKYATGRGNPSAESDGKSWITSALLGLLLLAGAYVILLTINPNILTLQIPGLPGLTAPSNVTVLGPSSGTGIPPSGPAGARCQAPLTGPCTVANLQNGCFASVAQTAAGVCNVESNGNAAALSGTDKCLDASGNLQPVSVGLFQINISANNLPGLNCTSAFDKALTSCVINGTCPPCHIVNQNLYHQCVQAAQNAATNITMACQIYNKGGWGQWGGATRAACGL